MTVTITIVPHRLDAKTTFKTTNWRAAVKQVDNGKTIARWYDYYVSLSEIKQLVDELTEDDSECRVHICGVDSSIINLITDEDWALAILTYAP